MGAKKILDETLRFGGGLLELLVLAHMEFQITPNKSQTNAHSCIVKGNYLVPHY
jgi:hypothetical protein